MEQPKEGEHNRRVWQWIAPATERAFRLIEMAAVLAVLKVVGESQHPDLIPRVVVVGAFGAAVVLLAPLFDARQRWIDSGRQRRKLLAAIGIILFVWAITTLVVFIVYELARLIAAYTSAH